MKGGRIGNVTFEFDVNFDDVQLQLPNLKLAGLPALIPDKRILLKPGTEEKPSEPVPVDYVLKLHTPELRPIRILSNLTPKYVPVAVDVVMKKDDTMEKAEHSGTVTIQKFPVKLFSRKATIEHLKLTLTDPIDKSAVEGLIYLPCIDMTIILELVGTAGEPVISLASRPPMTQNDIISTLLYGEPMNALDSDRSDSVNNMNAALANNSIALTTFLLLGSTPIQSIGYNPDTGLFTARVKLGRKTSLLMSSSETSKELGLRRRLGKGFSIKSGYEKIDESTSGAATTYIEWSKRY